MMITFQAPNPHRHAAIVALVDSALARIAGDPSVPGGYDVLRYFLNGWIMHANPAQQQDLALFAWAHGVDGSLVPEASAQGYAILRAAVAGELVSTLPPQPVFAQPIPDLVEA